MSNASTNRKPASRPTKREVKESTYCQRHSLAKVSFPHGKNAEEKGLIGSVPASQFEANGQPSSIEPNGQFALFKSGDEDVRAYMPFAIPKDFRGFEVGLVPEWNFEEIQNLSNQSDVKEFRSTPAADVFLTWLKEVLHTIIERPVMNFLEIGSNGGWIGANLALAFPCFAITLTDQSKGMLALTEAIEDCRSADNLFANVECQPLDWASNIESIQDECKRERMLRLVRRKTDIIFSFRKGYFLHFFSATLYSFFLIICFFFLMKSMSFVKI